jgi:hypothetical protein
MTEGSSFSIVAKANELEGTSNYVLGNRFIGKVIGAQPVLH